MDPINTILLGYSGHAFVVAEAAVLGGMHLLGYTESSKKDLNPFDLDFLGDERSTSFEHWNIDHSFILGIGDNGIRSKVATLVKNQGMRLQTVIHPNASVSSSAVVGDGTFVARNAAVNPLASIGQYCILNTSCSIDHECRISDGVHIAPGAVLAGNVTVGRGSFIGANAVIKEGVTIGENAMIGAGSVVINDVSDHTRVVGNPARRI